MTLNALPDPNQNDGTPRRVGIEVECGGLDEDTVAEIVRDTLGGTITRTADYERRVDDTEIGTVEILLDTAYRDRVERTMERLRPTTP